MMRAQTPQAPSRDHTSRIGWLILLGCSMGQLSGCATYEATLINAQGQNQTCERFGPSGMITGYFLIQGLRDKFDSCFDDAKRRGFFK